MYIRLGTLEGKYSIPAWWCNMSNFTVRVQDLTNFDRLVQELKDEVMNSCTDVVNDIVYTARGSAPHDTGYLEKCISATIHKGNGTFKAEVGVSAYDNGFDYGALRHDYPFNLGPGSQAKSPSHSNITGNTYPVGYNFAAGSADANADGYCDFIEENIQQVLDNY